MEEHIEKSGLLEQKSGLLEQKSEILEEKDVKSDATKKENESDKKTEEKPAFVFKRGQIPREPGCYLYFDEKDEIIYVGKAKNLRNRVSSYFNATQKGIKTQVLVQKIRNIATRVVQTESEALILENNLIKKHRPRFNILLRDDKTYLYLKITNEPIPKIMTTRRIVRDGSFYLGPKTNNKALYRTLKFCQKVFQIRTCKLTMDVEEKSGIGTKSVKVLKNPEKRKIPCMDFHLKRCSGPCSGDCSVEEYQTQVQMMKKFLRGDTKAVEQDIKTRMMRFANEKNFEAAAKMRDLLLSIEASTEKQVVEFTDGKNRDFWGVHRDEKKLFWVRILYRNGKMVDINEGQAKADPETPLMHTMEAIFMQFYPNVDELPHEIYSPVPFLPNVQVVLEESLQHMHESERKVSVIHPERGEKLRVMTMANRNAKLYCDKTNIQQISYTKVFKEALPDLTKQLNLPEPPRRMECYDISHFGGTETVASMVVFEDGEPKKSQYRRFKIKTLEKGKIDDFESMREVLTRRFANKSKKFAENLPDLVVIDGGKGQLSAVMEAVEQFDDFPDYFDPSQRIISIAKREEEIFRPNIKEPLVLPHESSAVKLLQRIRDEAHRFAITYNRNLRVKKQTKSVLDEVDGIGPATKKRLVRQFGSAIGVKNATDEELLTVLNQKQLKSLRNYI